MKLIEVTSSNIHKIGYDEETSKLGIVFNNDTNQVYEYDNVPKNVYEQLINAESIGHEFHVIVKDLYNFTKKAI